MEKIMLWLHRPSYMGSDEFGSYYLERHVPRLLVRNGICRYVANLVDHSQANLAAAGLQQGELKVGAVDELWCESLPDPFELLKEAYAWAPALAYYRVEEQVHLDYERSRVPGRRSPGVKVIFCFRRALALTPKQFTDYWRTSHVPKALKHHIGMWGYSTNAVTASVLPDAPQADGFSLLHFPSNCDLEERFFDSPVGEQVILADVKQFVYPRTISCYQVSEFIQRW